MGRAPGSWRCAGAFVFDYSYLINYYHNVHPHNHKEGKVLQEEERLSLREAADALGVSEVTARRWIKSGKLKAHPSLAESTSFLEALLMSFWRVSPQKHRAARRLSHRCSRPRG